MVSERVDRSTADLCDAYAEAIESCDLQFRQYGGVTAFAGPAVTLRAHEDNLILKAMVAEAGLARVLVVDAGGTTRVAMIGDSMAAEASRNGWAGVIINGAVRDVAELRRLPIGIKALGSNPRRSRKQGVGERDVPVMFGGALFRPGAIVVSDEDGIIVMQ